MKDAVLKSGVNRVLVLALGGAGDTLMLGPLFRELRLALPDAEIDALVMQGESAAGVLRGHPCVDNVILHDFRSKGLLSSLSVCLSLRSKRYDGLISPMPHHRLEHNLIALLIGGGMRFGFRYAIKSGAFPGLLLHRVIDEDTRLHIVDNNLRILPELFGWPRSSTEHRLEFCPGERDHAKVRELIKSVSGGSDFTSDCWIALHAGSGTTKNLELKRWPASKWAALIQLLARTEDLRMLLLCGPGEEGLCEQIRLAAGISGNRLMVLPVMPIAETAALLSQVRCVVCCDNLLTQLAAAMNTPCVALFGPTSHVFAPPYRVAHRIVRTGISCSPCYGYSKLGIQCTNSVFLKCMRELDEARVQDAILDLLRETVA